MKCKCDFDMIQIKGVPGRYLDSPYYKCFKCGHEKFDNLIITDRQKPLAQKIYDNLNEHKTISIGGLSGSGKSEVAYLLKELMRSNGKFAKILSQDQFYKPGHEQARKESLSQVGKEEIDWNRLWRSVENCKGTVDYIIVEGLYALYAETDFKVLIDCSYEESYGFRMYRGKERPSSAMRQKILALEKKSVDKSKQYADLILQYEEAT